MKKKDLIFYAGAAVLMAVSAQGVSADELVSNEATTTEGNQVQAEKAPEVAVAEKSVAPVASNYAAPANVTEPAVAPVSKAAASESGTPSVEKATEASTTEKEETPLPSDSGSTTFFNTGAHAPAGRSTDVAVQPKSFVDVSSHNGDISIGDYRTLANKGVGGVVVKLTEDTWYKNPNAENQIRNAQAAGLQVSTYHFSRYTSEEAARAEARFYIAEAQRLNIPKNTLMVNDFEDAKMQPNINRNTQAWADEMRKNGYTNLMFYTSASWLDENNLRKKGPVNTAQFGLQNFWIAQYPSPKLSVNDAKSLRYNGKAGAWQFTSQAELLPGKHLFDHSVDYTGRFARELHVTGLVNVQYAVSHGRVYVIEVNPRSSRTVPYISKVTGVPMVDMAVRCCLGEKLTDMGYGTGLHPNAPYVAVKVPVFSFEKLHAVDTQFGPEMKSTGEVLGIAPNYHDALLKGLIGAGYTFKTPGPGSCCIFTVKDSDKPEFVDIAWKLKDMGYKLYGTSGTCAWLNKHMVPCNEVRNISGEAPNIVDLLQSGLVDYVFSTSAKGRDPRRDSVRLRRKAVELSIPCITAVDTAASLVDCLRSEHSLANIPLVDIATLYRGK